MNTLLIKVKKLPETLAYPLSFTAIALIIVNIISFIPIEKIKELSGTLNNQYEQLLCVGLSGYIAFSVCKNAKKSILVSICTLLLNFCCYTLCDWQISIIIIVIFSFILSYIVNNNDLLFGGTTVIILTVITALIFSVLYLPVFNFTKVLAGSIKGNGPLFSAFDSLLSLTINSKFSDLFYYSGYSSSQVIGDKIVSGAINIFKANTENPQTIVSHFLSGKYFINIFVAIGMFLYIYKKLDRKEMNCLTLLTILSAVFGISDLFSFYILIYNPILYFAYLGLTLISYLLPGFVDISIGFVNNASLFELIQYGNRWIYFILIGLVIGFMSFVLAIIVDTKYNFQNRRLYPKEVKKILNALGGEDNIDRITADNVLVKNPNLIDIIKLDCDVHQNRVTLLYDDFELLKKYY
ncbi:MAG: hypothetical protein ACI4IG_05355 [Eubacterium sp.]